MLVIQDPILFSISTLSTKIFPDVGLIKPEIKFKNVVLPFPLSPEMQIKSF